MFTRFFDASQDLAWRASDNPLRLPRRQHLIGSDPYAFLQQAFIDFSLLTPVIPLEEPLLQKELIGAGRQARALLAITGPISGCWLVPTNGAPASCT